MQSPRGPRARSTWGASAPPLVLGALCLASIWAIGRTYAADFSLALGSLDMPRLPLLRFMAVYVVLGGLGAWALAVAASHVAPLGRALARLSRLIGRETDRAVISLGALWAFLLPFSARLFVFGEAPFTDDEGSYLFSAQLLADGLLYAPSQPQPAFFDHQFMFNDGRWFSQYFLGWPALLAPFAKLGVESLANPVYSALTVPPLYALARSFSGPRGARLALLLFGLSPQIWLTASTLLSHTSCLCALTWLGWTVRCTPGRGARPGEAARVALFFCVAFFIRPLTAVGLGLPLLLAWGVGIWRAPAGRLRALLCFSLPSLAFALAFLGVNLAQTGSAFTTAYQAVLDYKIAQGFRFAAYPARMLDDHRLVRLPEPTRMLATLGVATLRTNLALFGWPASLVLALAAWGVRRARFVWLAVAWFMASHVVSPSVGIDAFAPVHYQELAVPLILLSAVGYRRLAGLGSAGRAPGASSGFAAALVAALLLTGGVGYLPVRVSNLAELARRVNGIFRIAEREGIVDSVIFVGPQMWGRCNRDPYSHVLFRPLNRHDLRGDVLWLNSLGHQQNAAMFRTLNDKVAAYHLALDRECRPRLDPLFQRAGGATP